MRKVIINIFVLGILVGASFLKVFTITTIESVAVGAIDCFENCPENYDSTI